MSLTAIILAAGKATRMKSRRPKPLLEICGKPMLGWILDACWEAGVTRALVVVGHGKDQVIGQFGHDKRVSFVEQTEQLGTGHAAKMCEPQLKSISAGHTGNVLILVGDTPLMKAQTLKTLVQAHHDERAAGTMATAVLENPYGYGRVIRDSKGEFLAIVEESDCTPEQRAIREVFPSFYCLKIEDLLWGLGKLKNENKKSEYYLTDIFEILRTGGKKVAAVQAVAATEVVAPNTRQQLAEADAVMQDRIQRGLLENGISIVSTINTYIEADVTVGADTMIYPFSFIGRGSSVGAGCAIGPFAHVPAQAIVPEGARITGRVA